MTEKEESSVKPNYDHMKIVKISKRIPYFYFYTNILFGYAEKPFGT